MSAGDSDGRKPQFGDLLRAARIAVGLSQEALGARAGISTEAIGALERGVRRAPYRATVSQLASALGLSGDAFAAFESAAAHGRTRPKPIAPALQTGLHNVPVVLPSLIGRDAELGAMIEAIGSHRLITIVGFGGVGKTRLALEVARHMLRESHDPVWFVDLSVVRDGRAVCSTIATSIRPPVADYGDTPQGLASALRHRTMLLILDNCEHMIEDVACIAGLIHHGCPSVTIIATSREGLGIADEQAFRLSPLDVPAVDASADAMRTSAAVALFCERANALASPFVATAERISGIVDVCRAVDGIPLAIELAAGRLPTLGLQTLRTRLQAHFELTSGARDAVPRQRTMSATVAWSHDLLDERERILFRRLATFNGGSSLEAAEEVCSDETLPRDTVAGVLSSLADKSLVTVHQANDRVRYGMLELVRTYGLDLLGEAGEAAEMSRRHAQWLAALADGAGAQTFRMPSYATVLALAHDFANIISGLDWALSRPSPRAPLLGARIVAGLRSLWIASGQYVDLRRRVEIALEFVDEQGSPHVASRLLWAYFWSLSGAPRIRTAQRVIALLEHLGDWENVAIARMHCAYYLFRAGRVEDAKLCAYEGLLIIEKAGWYQSSAYIFYLTIRALLAGSEGRFDQARDDLNEADHLAKLHGEDYILMMWSPPLRLEVEFLAGNRTGAAVLAEETLTHAPETVADRLVFEALSALAAFHLMAGELNDAASTADELIRRAQGRDQEKVLCAITCLATVGAARGDAKTAARLIGFVDRCYELQGSGRNAIERSVYELLIDAVQSVLSGDVLRQLTREGATLGAEAATTEARDAAAPVVISAYT